MKQGYRKGVIYSNIQISTNIYEIKLSPCHPEMDNRGFISEGSGFQGEPGQFYMLRGWELDPFLPRPISICDISHGIITFLYEVRGRGTHIISKLKKGDTLELLGPLGNGFDLDIEDKIAIVSGGIGIAPLIYLMKSLKRDIDFYCGFRDEVYYLNEIEEYIENIYITTEDGSVGHKGFITELFAPERYDMVFTCGPIPMMKRVVEMCKAKDVPIHISMENRMACGIGTCLGCTIETTLGMERVCKEGPVFLGEEVIFDD